MSSEGPVQALRFGTHARRHEWIVGSAIILVALASAGWPVITNSTWTFPGDKGDGSLILYLLEHSWIWIQAPLQLSIWDPPFYYPITGVAAYGDLIAGSGPVYWIARFFGANIAEAATIWFVGQLVLNAFGGLWLFRGGLGFSPLASSAGAAMIVAANPMQNQFFHPQMVPLFYVLIAAGCILRAFRLANSESTKYLCVLGAMAATSFSFQMYSAFYHAWFLIFVSGVVFAVATIHPKTRTMLCNRLPRLAVPSLVGICITIVLLIPWATHYLPASKLSEPPTVDMIYGWLPRWFSWLYMGQQNRWYDFLNEWDKFSYLPVNERHEHRMGIGILTMVISGVGFIIARRTPWMQVAAVSIGLIIGITTILPGGLEIWPNIFNQIPGATAVRTISRIAIPIAILCSFAAATFVDWSLKHRKWWLAITAAIAISLEGSSHYPTFSPAEPISMAHDVSQYLDDLEGCKSFLYVSDAGDSRPGHEKQQTALWAGLISGIPTVNGYGHISPESWEFGYDVVNGELTNSELDHRHAAWELLHPESAPICVVYEKPDPSG